MADNAQHSPHSYGNRVTFSNTAHRYSGSTSSANTGVLLYDGGLCSASHSFVLCSFSINRCDNSELGDSWRSLSRHLFARMVRRVVWARPFDAGGKVAVSVTYIQQFPSRRQEQQVSPLAVELVYLWYCCEFQVHTHYRCVAEGTRGV